MTLDTDIDRIMERRGVTRSTLREEKVRLDVNAYESVARDYERLAGVQQRIEYSLKQKRSPILRGIEQAKEKALRIAGREYRRLSLDDLFDEQRFTVNSLHESVAAAIDVSHAHLEKAQQYRDNVALTELQESMTDWQAAETERDQVRAYAQDLQSQISETRADTPEYTRLWRRQSEVRRCLLAIDSDQAKAGSRIEFRDYQIRLLDEQEALAYSTIYKLENIAQHVENVIEHTSSMEGYRKLFREAAQASAAMRDSIVSLNGAINVRSSEVSEYMLQMNGTFAQTRQDQWKPFEVTGYQRELTADMRRQDKDFAQTQRESAIDVMKRYRVR